MKSFKTILSAGFLASALVLAGCGGGGESGPTEEEMAAMEAAKEAEKQKMEADAAIEAANMAALALDNSSDKAAVMAVETLISTANTEIMDLPEADRDDAMGMLAAAQSVVDAQNARITAQAEAADAKAAEDARKQAEADAAAEAAAEEARKAAAAMAVTAAKLYAGIAAQNGTAATTASGTAFSAGERAAAYNDDGTPTGATVDTRIMVGIGADTPVALSEDKKAMVADNHGWAGKRYTAEPDDDGMYEAMVYSNVGEPMMGKKFGHGAAANDEFEYQLTDGMLTIDTTSSTDIQKRVASSMFDQSAGVKTFKLPENTVAVMIPGMYHGVSGTYSCTPTAPAICASRLAADGFQLGTVTSATDSTFAAGSTGWTFKPTDPNARVMSVPDSIYASYGWWIHKSEDDGTYTASAFADVKGAVPAAAALNNLEGTATYMGGAAGKYALSSSTGGTNDAGHFTATATLEADFSDNSITGTIDSFMGADGMSRDWSVELKKAAVAATGGITRTEADDTVWTIGGTDAAASGAWSGTLYDNDDGGVPKVATGTFDSTYGTDGKMVGAFGANQQ